ncbi:MAG: TatD family hydrolase [Bacteroidales bacterium]|nr:TatD family hydrolase [Bacteroidales bacterium]
MIDKTKFIDIHTHQEPKGIDRVGVVNLYPDKIPEVRKDGYYSLGLHPWFIPEKGLDNLFKILEENALMPEIVAIGECGLDKLSKCPMNVQQKVFERQIEIAEQVQKPLIIHCVHAFNELVQTKMHSKSIVEWIVHGFNSNTMVADMLLRHEIYLSFGKALFNPQSNASKVILEVEDDMFLLETDDADVDIQSVYQAVSRLVDMDLDLLKLSMFTNFINCFKI